MLQPRPALSAPLLALAALLVAAPAGAQDATPEVTRVVTPLGRVHYDLATGRVTKVVRPGTARGVIRGAPPKNAARSTIRAFHDSVTQGTFTSGAVGAEFVDWAKKATGGEFTTRVVFGYATTLPDPTVSGPGASLDVSLYSGTTGFCTLGSEVGRLQFQGLPGVTGTLPSELGAGYVVTAFLSQALALPDGPIGWGYTFHDADASRPSGSATGPLLTDFGTNTGWSDAFDWWSASPASNGSCAGTFWFGGCSSSNPPPPTGAPCASFYLELAEFTPSATASCTVSNGSGTNPLQFQSLSGGPRIGQVWQGMVDLGAAPAGTVSVIAISAGGFLPVPLRLHGVFQNTELLIDPSLAVPLDFSLTGLHTLAVPADPTLDGLASAFQAAKITSSSGIPLLNALDCTFGG